MAISVDMLQHGGHSGGISVRIVNTTVFGNYRGYLFEVSNERQYKISLDNGINIDPIIDWRSSPLVQKGSTVKETLQVIAQGNTFLFYVNGQFLDHIQDSTYSAPGTVGFLATTQDGGSDADIVYTNLKIYQLS